jgi:hypothetical protein
MSDWRNLNFGRLQAQSYNCDDWLLALSCSSVCPSTPLSAWDISAPTGRIFVKFVIWVFSKTCWGKNQVSLNGTRIMGALHEDQYTFLSYLARFLLEWEMFRTKFVEEIKTHILWSYFFLKIVPFMSYCGKSSTAGSVTDGNMAHMLCMLDT